MVDDNRDDVSRGDGETMRNLSCIYPEYIQNTAKYTQAAKQKENQSVGKSAPEKRGLFVTTLYYIYIYCCVCNLKSYFRTRVVRNIHDITEYWLEAAASTFSGGHSSPRGPPRPRA